MRPETEFARENELGVTNVAERYHADGGGAIGYTNDAKYGVAPTLADAARELAAAIARWLADEADGPDAHVLVANRVQRAKQMIEWLADSRPYRRMRWIEDGGVVEFGHWVDAAAWEGAGYE